MSKMEEHKDSDTEEETIELLKPKKPRSEKQIAAFEIARKKRIESATLKNAEIKKIKSKKPDEVLLDKPIVEKKEKKVKQTIVYQEEESSEDEEVVIVKKRPKKPKKKIVYEEESESEPEIVKKKAPKIVESARQDVYVKPPLPSIFYV